MNPAVIAFLVVGVVVLIVAAVFLAFFKLWIRALLSKAPVSILSLVGMSLRMVNPGVVVDSRIMAVKAGLSISTEELETHYLARGNVVRVVQALVAASKANIPLTWKPVRYSPNTIVLLEPSGILETACPRSDPKTALR